MTACAVVSAWSCSSTGRLLGGFASEATDIERNAARSSGPKAMVCAMLRCFLGESTEGSASSEVEGGEEKAAAGGGGGVAEEKAAAGGGGGVAEEKAAAGGGGGVAEEKAAAGGGGGVAEEKAAAGGGGGVAERDGSVDAEEDGGGNIEEREEGEEGGAERGGGGGGVAGRDNGGGGCLGNVGAKSTNAIAVVVLEESSANREEVSATGRVESLWEDATTADASVVWETSDVSTRTA